MDQNPTFGFFTVERDREYLHGTISLAESAVAHGNTPFGALLAGPDGQVLMEQENVERTGHDCTGHAETALVRRASSRFSREFLAGCSLYTSVEPCVHVRRCHLLVRHRACRVRDVRTPSPRADRQ